MNQPISSASSEPTPRQRELDIVSVARHMLLDAPKAPTPFTTENGQRWLEATVRLARRVTAYEHVLKANGLAIPTIDERSEKIIDEENLQRLKDAGVVL